MASITITGTSTSSLTARVSGMLSSAKYIEFYIDGDLDKYYTLSGTSKSHTFTGLDPGTAYTVSAIVYDSNWDPLTFAQNSVTGWTDEEELEWSLGNQYTWSNLSAEKSQYLSFGNSGYVARFKITFANSGTATFYTTGSSDTYGYLSTSSTFDSSIGGPSSALEQNDDASDSNFNFQYTVTAGTTYYVWVRLYGIEDSGSTTFYVIPPVSSWKLGNQYTMSTLSETSSQYMSFGAAGYVARIAVTFKYSGTATFYGTGDYDSYGYLSTTTGFNATYGRPSSYIASDDDSGSGANFSFTYDVTAGTTYYVWVRLYSVTDTGSVTAYVDPPAGIAPWDWFTSNGAASAAQTEAAYNAVNGKGLVTDFNYLVWNDLVDKIYEAASFVGDGWDTQSNAFTTYASTKMSTSDKVLTAKRFNAVRWNIGLHYSTGLKDVYPGDTVYGSYFITLADCLNAWIDSI